MTTSTSTTRTAEEIRSDIAKLEGELAAAAGDGLIIEDDVTGVERDCPPGGALLTVNLAAKGSYTAWYPTAEAARAELAVVAREYGCKPDPGGWRVDLTAPGCHDSGAYVTRRQQEEETWHFDTNLGKFQLIHRPGQSAELRPSSIARRDRDNPGGLDPRGLDVTVRPRAGGPQIEAVIWESDSHRTALTEISVRVEVTDPEHGGGRVQDLVDRASRLRAIGDLEPYQIIEDLTPA